MDRLIRRRREMGLRVRDFSSVHPSADGSYALVLAELERQVRRLDELAGQQQGGVFTRRGSVARRKAERRRIHAELLRHLVTVAALAAALDAFDRTVVETNEGLRAHVGARAELKAVSDEIMRLVAMLDGLNRYRFSGNAELQAAWESAKKVVSGPNAAGRAPESPDAPRADGGVRPAA